MVRFVDGAGPDSLGPTGRRPPLHSPLGGAGGRTANSAIHADSKITAKPAFAAHFPAVWEQAPGRIGEGFAGYN